MGFLDRVKKLPVLGLGVSTEYGAFSGAESLDLAALRKEAPQWARFLEVGVEIEKGLDDESLRWVESKLPTTYHFLDVNLEEPDDLDKEWLDGAHSVIECLKPAWMCGDAG